MKPASISALAISTCAQKRWLKPTWRTTPASSQALTHAARGGGIDGERLLAEHMLAAGRGGDHAGLMEAVGGGDDHRVEIGEVEHRVEIVERLAAEIRGDGLGAGALGIEDGDERRAVAPPDRRRMAEPHDGAGADEADPDPW